MIRPIPRLSGLIRADFLLEDRVCGVGGDFEGEAEVDLVWGGWGGKQHVVGQAREVLGGCGGDACCSGYEPGLRGDGDLGSACGYCVIDSVGGVTD